MRRRDSWRCALRVRCTSFRAVQSGQLECAVLIGQHIREARELIYSSVNLSIWKREVPRISPEDDATVFMFPVCRYRCLANRVANFVSRLEASETIRKSLADTVVCQCCDHNSHLNFLKSSRCCRRRSHLSSVLEPFGLPSFTHAPHTHHWSMTCNAIHS